MILLFMLAVCLSGNFTGKFALTNFLLFPVSKEFYLRTVPLTFMRKENAMRVFFFF